MTPPTTTAITNIRVFNGNQLTSPTRVCISGDQIVSPSTEADVEIDVQGRTLLPGLIDAHCHVWEHEQLQMMAKAGVTTALDMGNFSLEKVLAVRNQKGLTDYYTAGIVLTAPDSGHSKHDSLPKEAEVTTADGARKFVNRRVAESMDYIKLIADDPGPSQEVLDAACEEAKRVEKLTIVHALTSETWNMAQKAKCDFATHVMIDAPIKADGVRKMIEEKRGCIPTLAIMEVVHQLGVPGYDYKYCEDSVRMMHAAGVTILAGTDSNAIPGSPAHVKHGESIVRELELLVKAGLSNAEALRAATSETAKCFGLKDRGVVEPGMRADLLLIEGNPLEDISVVRNVQRVWCGGIEVER